MQQLFKTNRTPGVAEGDVGVSLNLLGDVLAPEPELVRRPGDVADHPRGDGVGQGQGGAQSYHPLTGPGVLAGPELHPGQVLGADPHGGQVRLDIHILHHALEHPPVLESHLRKQSYEMCTYCT